MITQSTSLIHFLQQELAIPADSIDLALRYEKLNPSQFIMTLWQYGLVTKEQLERLFDWLDCHNLEKIDF